MSQAKEEFELFQWMSTYGLITAERVLERFDLRLHPEILYLAIKNPNAFYHLLLNLPLRNIYNGIILQQAYDYQVYAQKIIIDYLMSGESSKPAESTGAFTRDDIENQRKELVEMANDFQECELEHKQLIAESQKDLIEKTKAWQKLLLKTVKLVHSKLMKRSIIKSEDLIKKIINLLLVDPEVTDQRSLDLEGKAWNQVEKLFGESLSTDLKQTIRDEIQKLKELGSEIIEDTEVYAARISNMTRSLRAWRSDFYNKILRINDYLKLLPEYHANTNQIEANQESLLFDRDIGEGE